MDAAVVVRITSDCPYVDPAVSDAVVLARRASGLRYARTAISTGFPLGFDTEVVTFEALQEADDGADDPYEREHVTPYIWRRPDRFPAIYVDRVPDLRSWRLVVDAPEDYMLARAVYDDLGPDFRLGHLVELFARRPDLLTINRDVGQTPYVGLPGPGNRTRS